MLGLCWGQSAGGTLPRSERLTNGLTWVWVPKAGLAQDRVVLAFRHHSDAVAPVGVARWFVESLAFGSDSFGSLNLAKEAELRNRLVEQSRLLNTPDPRQREAVERRIRNLQRESAPYILPLETTQLYELIGSHLPQAEFGAEGLRLHGRVPAPRLAAWLELTALNLSRPAFRCSDRLTDRLHLLNEGYRRSPQRAWADSCRAALLGPSRDGLKTYRLPPRGFPPLSALRFWHEGWFDPARALVLIETAQPFDSVRTWVQRSVGRWPAVPAREPNSPTPAALPKPARSIACGHRASEVLVLPWVGRTHAQFEALAACRYRLCNDYRTGAFDRLQLNGLADTLEWAVVEERERSWLLIRFHPPAGGKLSGKFRQAVEMRLDSLLRQPVSAADLIRSGRSARGEIQTRLQQPMLRLHELARRWQRGDTASLGFFVRHFSLDPNPKLNSDSVNFYLNENWSKGRRFWLQLKAEKAPKPQPMPEPHAVGARDSLSEWGQQFVARWGARQRPSALNLSDACATLTLGLRQLLYHVPDADSTHFDLRIRYHLGSYRLLSLPQLCAFLNAVGTYKKKAEELQDSLERYGTHYRFVALADQMEVRVWGRPSGLRPTLSLLQELVDYPDRDYATLDRVIRRETARRAAGSRDLHTLGQALGNYLINKSFSPEVRRLSTPEMRSMLEPARLRDSLRRLTQLPVTVYYRGPHALEAVHRALTTDYQLPKRSRRPRRPLIKKIAYYRKPEILIYHLAGASQAYVTAYAPGNPLPIDSLALAWALNLQLGTGEGSLLLEDVYVRRRMAYEARAELQGREQPGLRAVFRTELVCSPERCEEALRAIRQLVRQPNLAGPGVRRAARRVSARVAWSRPDSEGLGQWVDSLRRDSCQTDPAPAHFDSLQAIDSNKMEAFFAHHLRKKPLSYAIVADKKKLDLEKLGRYGEVRFVPLDEFWKP